MKRIVLIAAALLVFSSAVYAQNSTSIRNSIFSQIENAGLRGWDISVDARYGKVTLDGSVATEKDRQTVENIALKTAGVERLESNLRVTGADPYGNSRLEQAIRSDLMARPDLRNFNFEVSESQGKVVLSGQARTERESQVAEQVARSHGGVREVRNQITVLAPLNDSELAANVRRALSHEQNLDLEGLDVMSENGTVVFRGSRPDFRDIDRILSIALMVDGVKNIKNEMTIGQQEYLEAPGTAR